MSETDILKKVQDKLDNERATDIINQMKTEPKELKIDIPNDPFIEKSDEILPDDGEDLPPEHREDVDEGKNSKMVFDKRYTSGDEDSEAQIDYFIQRGVLREPEEVKKEFRQSSVNIAQPIIKKLESGDYDSFTSDCPMAGAQIDSIQNNNIDYFHPMTLLRKAYGD